MCDEASTVPFIDTIIGVCHELCVDTWLQQEWFS
jgi:hypothetical protein